MENTRITSRLQACLGIAADKIATFKTIPAGAKHTGIINDILIGEQSSGIMIVNGRGNLLDLQICF